MRVGCPIRKSQDHSSVTSSSGLIAGSNVLHRLSTPSHPPCALMGRTNLTPRLPAPRRLDPTPRLLTLQEIFGVYLIQSTGTITQGPARGLTTPCCTRRIARLTRHFIHIRLSQIRDPASLSGHRVSLCRCFPAGKSGGGTLVLTPAMSSPKIRSQPLFHPPPPPPPPEGCRPGRSSGGRTRSGGFSGFGSATP